MGEGGNVPMRRIFSSTALGLLALLVFAMPAMAGKNWCARDPIVSLNGKQLQIWVAIPEEYVRYVNGPIKTRVSTPNGVARKIVFLDSGFNNFGEDLKFGYFGGKVAPDGTFDVKINVVVPVDKKKLETKTKLKNIPLRLEIVFPDGSTRMVEMTNDGTWLQFRL